MNFITKIFNNKKEIYLLSAINELKEDKKHLYDELTKKDANEIASLKIPIRKVT